jgi:hypothetical protein
MRFYCTSATNSPLKKTDDPQCLSPTWRRFCESAIADKVMRNHNGITRDKPQDRSGGKSLGAESSTSEPKGQELVYAARISLDRTQMRVEDNLVNLSPGMAVTVAVKTGSRAILTYLLSPLLRYKQESLRER